MLGETQPAKSPDVELKRSFKKMIKAKNPIGVKQTESAVYAGWFVHEREVCSDQQCAEKGPVALCMCGRTSHQKCYFRLTGRKFKKMIRSRGACHSMCIMCGHEVLKCEAVIECREHMCPGQIHMRCATKAVSSKKLIDRQNVLKCFCGKFF